MRIDNARMKNIRECTNKVLSFVWNDKVSLALLQEKANIRRNCKYENSCLKKYKTRQMYI